MSKVQQAFREAAGMPEERRRALAEADERRSDWIGRCSVCGQRVPMTLAEARRGACRDCAAAPVVPETLLGKLRKLWNS